MHLPFFALVLLATTSRLFAETGPNTLAPEEKAAGWALLFDGISTAGWKSLGGGEFPAKGWAVRDGMLIHGKGGGGGDVVTAEQYEDFTFSWEWRLAEAGNSGVKYNLPEPTKGLGCEYQLLDDARHPDGKQHGTTRQTGALYDVIAPAGAKPAEIGQWNLSRIVVAGNKVEHWLNGVKVVDFEFGGDALKAAKGESKFKGNAAWGKKTKSPILLQDHGDEVAFRSLKILNK